MYGWKIQAPHARVEFCAYDHGTAEAFSRDIAKIPGVKAKNGFWLITHHALEYVEAVRSKYRVDLKDANWVVPMPKSATWDEVSAKLRAGNEVYHWLLDGTPSPAGDIINLTPYQKDGISFGWHKPGVHFWHSTGAGKSISGILSSLSTKGPVLLITKSAARIQLSRELERFTNLKAFVIKSMSSKRKKDKTLSQYMAECHKEKRRPFVIMGWPNLSYYIEELEPMWWGSVIFDESHVGKNHKRYEVVPLAGLPLDDLEEAMRLEAEQQAEAKRCKGFIVPESELEGRKLFIPLETTATAAARLSRKTGKRIALSATPLSNRVRDLWAQLDLIEPNAWGNATLWLDRYCDRKPGQYGGFDTNGSSNTDELVGRLKNIAHRVPYRDTHKHLPAKRRQSYYIAPEDQVKPTGKIATERKNAAKANSGRDLETRLQHAASSKRKAALELIEQHVVSGQKVLVFTGRREDCAQLGGDVAKMSSVKATGAATWFAHGEMAFEDRQKLVDDYMAHPGPCVFVATMQAFGTSLNLHDTDALLFVQLPLTPEQLRQAEGRVARLGQKRPVVVYFVIAEGTIDEHWATVLISKLPAVGTVTGDDELVEAEDALAGRDEAEFQSLAASVLAFMDAPSGDSEPEEDDD